MGSGQWTLDSGQWTVESEEWKLDSGQWTLDSGQWTEDTQCVCSCVHDKSTETAWKATEWDTLDSESNKNFTLYQDMKSQKGE